MTQALNSPQALLNGVAPLPDLGVIRARGDDAASFLHGQLTQDVLLLPDGQARLAGYCSAKGRLLASFVLLRLGVSEIWLVCDKALLPGTLKRLSMFVLRAKVKLDDASAELAVRGLAGEFAQRALPAASPAWAAAGHANGHAIALYPAAGVPRALWVGPLEDASLPGPSLPESVWAWSDVLAAVPMPGALQIDTFVPQMLNHESVGMPDGRQLGFQLGEGQMAMGIDKHGELNSKTRSTVGRHSNRCSPMRALGRACRLQMVWVGRSDARWLPSISSILIFSRRDFSSRGNWMPTPWVRLPAA